MLTLEILNVFYKRVIRQFVKDIDFHECFNFEHTVKYDAESKYHKFQVKIDDREDLLILATTTHDELESLKSWAFCHNLRDDSETQVCEFSSAKNSESDLIRYIAYGADNYESRMRAAVNDVMSGMRW